MNQNIKSITRIFGLILVIIIAFTIGFMFARRENYNQSTNSILTKADNGFIENSLTKIQSRIIYGVVEGEKKQYGQLFFKIVDEKDTELLIQIENFPQNITRADKTNFSIDSLDLKLASICCNGLDYNLQNTGLKLKLETRGGKKTVKFSSILDMNILNGFDRVVLTNEIENPFKVTKDGERDWPRNTTEKPAPYLWVNI
jgi:hypothetical protein